jgi:hypothetical protein
MKIKTVDLTGAALDWAVATANGDYPYENAKWGEFFTNNCETLNYSTNWAHGGPIIERECIQLEYRVAVQWIATRVEGSSVCEVSVPYNQKGRPQLIAAMRCYVMSQLGDEIEIPEELK